MTKKNIRCENSIFVFQLESVKSRLQTTTAQFEKSQQARNELERLVKLKLGPGQAKMCLMPG